MSEITAREYVDHDVMMDCYEQHVLKGPISVLFELIEKEHYPAVKDILPLIKESLARFNVTPVEPELSAEIDATVAVDLTKSLTTLAQNVAELHALMSRFSETTGCKTPETIENPV